MKYPYFRGLEADRYSFYRVPKALIKVDLFEKMSGDAKLLYAVLLDRMNNKWHPSTVLRILNSSAYIGELVSGKTQTASYKGIGLHPVEKREWHIVENAHEAIILKSDFEKVQARREQNKEKRERAMARSKVTRVCR